MQENIKNSKSSRQRDLVLKVLRSTGTHPTADWIYQQARGEMPNISLGTVYRNLIQLENDGKIRKLSFMQGNALYDGDLRDHYHVRCEICLRVADVPHIASRVSYEEVEEMTGFEIHSLQLEFTGLCPDCCHSSE